MNKVILTGRLTADPELRQTQSGISSCMIRRADGSVQPSGTEALYKAVEQLVAMDPDERRTTFQQRRQQMLDDKIDCAKFLTYFIESYPGSVEETKNANDAGNSEFWKRFK